MHLQSTPDKIAALAPFAVAAGRRSSGRGRDAVAILKRNEAIAAAVHAGHPALKVGQIVGLTVRSVREIANEITPSSAPAPATAKRPATPMRGVVTFDQADASAIAVLRAQPGTCRWVEDANGGFAFCGARVVQGQSGGLTLRSYCAAHAARVYGGRLRIMVAEAA